MADLAGIARLDLHHLPAQTPPAGRTKPPEGGAMLATFIQEWGGTGSAIGLLAATVWMVFTGRLVPRKVHEQAIAAERQRGDDWREVARTQTTRAELSDRQLDEVLAFVRSARETA
jgi:hypothetical protein